MPPRRLLRVRLVVGVRIGVDHSVAAHAAAEAAD